MKTGRRCARLSVGGRQKVPGAKVKVSSVETFFWGHREGAAIGYGPDKAGSRYGDPVTEQAGHRRLCRLLCIKHLP